MGTTSHQNPGNVPGGVGGRSVWRRFSQAVKGFNVLTGYLSGITIVVTSVIVCYGVVMRYFFHPR